MFRWLLALMVAVPCLNSATELQPWFGRDYEVEARATYLFQSYRKVATPHRHFNRDANDSFLTLSASLPWKDLNGELETTFAYTRHQHPAWDNLRLTGRYRLMNDVNAEDPVALTAGITATIAAKHSVQDISSFHHGRVEGEFHVAVGKEFPCEEFWMTRAWAVVGVGVAEKGSPWIRANAVWERNWWDQQQVRFFMNTLWGLGKRNLCREKSFHGYGPIRHQSVEIGARYSYAVCGAILSLEFAHRVYARNFPAHANLIMAQVFYPFSVVELLKFP